MIKQIYNYMPPPGGRRYSMFKTARNLLIKFLADPDVKYRINSNVITIPLSHALPIYKNEHSNYDRLPERLSLFVTANEGSVKCIDVGANVGDTIATMLVNPDDQFIAVEPSETFYPYLEINFGEDPRVALVKQLLSNYTGIVQMENHEVNGTGSFKEADSGASTFAVSTLDELMREGNLQTTINVLKIDTDGHDFRIIKGGEELLVKHQPFVLFECGFFDKSDFNELGAALDTLDRAGYKKFLVYDNRGLLHSIIGIENRHTLKNCMLYVLSGGVSYYDILALPTRWAEEFTKQEINHFSDPAQSNEFLSISR